MTGILATLGAKLDVLGSGILAAGPAYQPPAPSNSWDIKNLLTNSGNTLASWAQLLMIIIGLVMVIVGIFQIAKGLISGGGQRGQTNWIVAILLIILGGAIGMQGLGGWNWVAGVATSGVTTLEQLAEGSLMLLPFGF